MSGKDVPPERLYDIILKLNAITLSLINPTYCKDVPPERLYDDRQVFIKV
jgi:hypothetical protein